MTLTIRTSVALCAGVAILLLGMAGGSWASEDFADEGGPPPVETAPPQDVGDPEEAEE